MAEINYERLINEFLRDENRFDEIYNSTYAYTYSYVYSRVPSASVDDCIQCVYVKLYQGLKSYDRSKGDFSPWFHTVVHNETVTYIKKNVKIRDAETSLYVNEDEDEYDIPDESYSPEQIAEQAENAKIISNLLNKLSDEQRMCILLHYKEGLSEKEIAAYYGISVNTVKSRMRLGKKKIELEVLELEKQGTKLLALPPIVYFLFLLKNTNSVCVSPSGKAMVLSSVKNQIAANASISTIASSIGVTVDETVNVATGTAAGTVAKAAIGGITTKIVIGATAGTIAIGGLGFGAYKIHEKIEDSTSYIEETMDEEVDASADDEKYVEISESEYCKAFADYIETADVLGWGQSVYEKNSKTPEIDRNDVMEYAFAYIDDDDIPEMLCNIYSTIFYHYDGIESVSRMVVPDETHVLKYIDGKVVDVGTFCGYNGGGFYEKSNIISQYQGGEWSGTDTYFSINGNSLEEVASMSWQDSESGEGLPSTYTILGHAVSEGEYRACLSEFTSKEKWVNIEYFEGMIDRHVEYVIVTPESINELRHK